MKTIGEEGYVKIRKALAAAYHEKEKDGADDLWQARVMGHIRNLGSLYSRLDYFEHFQQFVWRLVPVTCALALLLGVAIIHTDFISDYELAKILINDPADISLLALYNGQ